MERESEPIRVETMPGVICSRFARPIGSVGLYVCVLTSLFPVSVLETYEYHLLLLVPVELPCFRGKARSLPNAYTHR